MVMETAKPALKPIMAKHLKELMAHSEVYGWAPVLAYHAVWLQQILNNHVQWSDTNARLGFRQALVW